MALSVGQLQLHLAIPPPRLMKKPMKQEGKKKKKKRVVLGHAQMGRFPLSYPFFLEESVVTSRTHPQCWGLRG